MNRILVVHRDRLALDRLEKLLLDRADHQITLVDSIDAALAELVRSSPALVLLCLPLNKTPGRDAVAALHSVEPKMPVVVLSSKGAPTRPSRSSRPAPSTVSSIPTKRTIFSRPSPRVSKPAD